MPAPLLVPIISGIVAVAGAAFGFASSKVSADATVKSASLQEASAGAMEAASKNNLLAATADSVSTEFEAQKAAIDLETEKIKQEESQGKQILIMGCVLMVLIVIIIAITKKKKK
jgi:hypothetical protein